MDLRGEAGLQCNITYVDDDLEKTDEMMVKNLDRTWRLYRFWRRPTTVRLP